MIRDDDDDVLRNVIILAIFGITLDDVQVRCSWKFPSFSEGLFYLTKISPLMLTQSVINN